MDWVLRIIRGGNYFLMITLLLMTLQQMAEKFDFDLLKAFATWRVEQIKQGEQPPQYPTVDQPNIETGE